MLVITRKEKTIYNVIMVVLSLLIASILVVQITFNVDAKTSIILSNIAHFIWIVFVFDYAIRLLFNSNKKDFIKNNVIDLISIIPFHTIYIYLSHLAGFNAGKYAILLKLVMVLRILAIIKRSNSNFYRLIRTNNFSYTLFIAIFIIFLSSLSMSYLEHWSMGDSLWWSIVTVTTVGYGYICPKTFSGRIVASILMIFGIGFIGSLTSTLSTYFIRKENSRHSHNNHISSLQDTIKDVVIGARFSKDEYKDMVILDIVNRLENFDDLSKEEVSTMCNVLSSLKGNSSN